MFMPLFPLRLVTAFGLNESDLGDRLREVAAPLGIRVQADPEPERNRFIRSDQYNFIKAGVPALAFKVGYEKGSAEEATAKAWLKERYHAPSDDVGQPVDLKAAGDFNRMILALVEAVANREARPEWKRESFFRRFQQGRDRPEARPTLQ
jgi:Zn-dependent M28 family amino/carboxypeptidase